MLTLLHFLMYAWYAQGNPRRKKLPVSFNVRIYQYYIIIQAYERQ